MTSGVRRPSRRFRTVGRPGWDRGPGSALTPGVGFEFLRTEAQLFPYGGAPEGRKCQTEFRKSWRLRARPEISLESTRGSTQGEYKDEIGDLARSQVTEAIFTQEYGRARVQIAHRIAGKKVKLAEARKTRTPSPGKPDKATQPSQSSQPSQMDKSIKKGGEIYGKNLWSEIEKYTQHVRQLAETHQVDVVHAHDWMTFPSRLRISESDGSARFSARACD